jgi:hypothetical protein
MEPIKLHHAGARERNAFNLWVDENTQAATLLGVRVPAAPRAKAQAEATYDPISDAITWRGVTRTIGEIVNGMPGEIAEHKPETATAIRERVHAEFAQERELFGASAALDRKPSETHRILLEQEIRRVAERAQHYRGRIERGSADAEDRDAFDFWQRLGLALVRMRGVYV